MFVTTLRYSGTSFIRLKHLLKHTVKYIITLFGIQPCLQTFLNMIIIFFSVVVTFVSVFKYVEMIPSYAIRLFFHGDLIAILQGPLYHENLRALYTEDALINR